MSAERAGDGQSRGEYCVVLVAAGRRNEYGLYHQPCPIGIGCRYYILTHERSALIEISDPLFGREQGANPMARFHTLDDIDVRRKRVLLRADLNVPVKDGVVSDATRIERLAPTITALTDQGAKVVVMSHFGRPQGKPDPAYSLRPLIASLRKAIGGREVIFAADCIGEAAKGVVTNLRPGQVALLENLRFHRGEEENSADFARALAELGDLYVDDAFSAAHRAHASIDALARLLPAAAGKLMEAELAALTAALDTPKRPVLALIGGAKVSTKLDLLRFLIGKVDVLAIGLFMTNTLLTAIYSVALRAALATYAPHRSG